MLGFGDRRHRRVRFFAIVLALVTLLVAGALASCSSSSSTGLTPTTGILIRAETLTSGRGCGPDSTQLFKYVAIVFQYDGGDASDRGSYTSVHTTNVFDCYTDGAFISLPPSVGGNSSFRLEVFAYNREAYEATRATIDEARDLGRRDPAKLAALSTFSTTLRETTTPTWTTECTATQQPDVQALASCDPLSVGLGGLISGGGAGPTAITLDTAQFRLANGRLATCASPSDGGVGDAGDAGDADIVDASDDAGDAGDADASTPADAGPPLSFSKVRVRTRIGAQILADETVDCPVPYSLGVPPEPTRYDLDVGLLDPAGNVVDPAAQTLCTVTSRTGGSSSAVCP
ncbi:MAG: hypothetical protein K0S65_4833 [Labilithrix sp.]|nr:hypothetical protein [Labilithrix sp.]